MKIIRMKEFEPLSSHQVGIKIKNIILNSLNEGVELVVLDFDGIDICTDSFVQQLTTILSEEISFKRLKEKIKFKNLNNFLMELIKGKLHIASQQS